MAYNPETSQEQSLAFLASVRGRYIVSKALYHALKVLEAVQPEILQEKSDMADMQYLREMLFDFPDLAFEKLAQRPPGLDK
jgi:hypothetical protein